MKTSTLLKKSLKVLEEKGWTQGPMARNKYRHGVKPNSPSAVKFCAIGAVANVLNYSGEGFRDNHDFMNAMDVLNRSAGGSIVFLNESGCTEFKDVKAAFKNAIKAAKAQGN